MDYRFYRKQDFVEEASKMHYYQFIEYCNAVLTEMKNKFGAERDCNETYCYIRNAQFYVNHKNEGIMPASASESDIAEFEELYKSIKYNTGNYKCD